MKDAIFSLKKEYDVRQEIKWTNIFAHKEKFYHELIDLFFATEMMFRAIVIKKEDIDEQKFKTFDDFYYKMYYQLLYHKMSMENAYNIYIDIKDTLGAYRIKKLKNILNIEYSSIRNIQSINSKESVFMQLSDFIMGAINYRLNVDESTKTGKVSKVKNRLIHKIEREYGHSLERSTAVSKDKLNLFFIELK